MESKHNSQLINKTNLILIHYGELALKGANRKWFEEKVVNNIRANLDGFNISRVERQYGRVIINFAEMYDIEALKDRFFKVFGVASFAAVVRAGTDLKDIEETVLSGLNGRQERTFAVRTKRADKRLPSNSQLVNERIGSRICELTGLRVDLEKPDITIRIERLSDATYISFDKFKGAGGLPTGTSGKVACLISGGIDSPVAAWRMMRRGCEVNFIHFHSAPFTDAASKEKVEELVGRLSKWQCGRGKFAFVPLGNIQKKIVTLTNEKYRVILYRRFMIRIAEKIARELGCEALITGEALGQVASQTLSNMATVDSVSNMPILRPLVGLDKQEIVDQSRIIGTYDISIEPHQDCCQFLEPRHPVTKTSNEELNDVEKSLNIDDLVKEGLTAVEWKC